ncbi:D-Ala-D-Ala carboxypeptidase family metallohydrolase [Sphingobium limneticum]|uniref:Peptidase M15 n=1 Tax=Sphingobium limneticum TaxID=1007511 RepID=A0A5J5I905_9SPHN|nr:D-Ala-D-Ala carboxypeptidase family metallohydrolase [Sphingobium limneticum]KAA9018288.1 peptidase M15 [Sphingobium limneticum]KAA9030924.1 peptidase M15 [Sphingobium limneticum]
MTQLSKHFTLAEMTVTTSGLANNPNPQQLARLTATAQAMEPVRALLAAPIRVNSGFRSAAVNKAVGGKPTSAHAQGYAVDFVCPAFGDPMTICRAIVASGIKFDQLIMEKNRWVHLSFDPRMRQQVLSWWGGPYKSGLVSK